MQVNKSKIRLWWSEQYLCQERFPFYPTHLSSSTPAFPLHTFFECPAGSENGSWLSLDHAWVWIIMFLSQVTSKTKDPSNTLFWKIRFLKRQLTKKPQSRHPDLDQCSTVRMLMTIRMKPRSGSLLRSGFPRAGAWQPPTRYLGEKTANANAILTTKKLQVENWVNIKQTYFAFLFRTWYYNSLLVEQSLVLNRRSDDGKKSRKFDFKTKHFRQDFLQHILLRTN